MKQMSFADAEYAGKRKQTRREYFLIEMDQVVPWKGLIKLIEPHYPKGEGGRPAYPLMAMLRVHLMQNWFGYSDPAMEESLYETTILRQFAGLHLDRIPDETTILNFRRLLEKHELAGGILQVINGYLGDRGLLLRHGTVVDATIIHAPSSTKNKDGKRDPEMHQTKKGNQYFFGMKSHIGVDAESGLVHSVVGTAANVADVTQVDQLLHGEEIYVSGDAGYTGVGKRAEHQDRPMIWSIAARPSSYRKHAKKSLIGRMRRKIEYAKAQVRAKVEHPFRVIKRQFGYTKVRFRGLVTATLRWKSPSTKPRSSTSADCWKSMSWPVGFCRSSTAIWATEVCCYAKELWSMRRSFMRPVRPRTRTVNATPKCTRQRKEISTISG